MKKIKILLGLIIVNVNILYSQNISFTSYSAITNPQFKNFTELFEQKSLPLSADDIIATLDIWHLNKTPLSTQQVNTFLKHQNKLIPGPLYLDEPADSLPAKPVDGKFYPLYKLPTNGNYVLLVFAQVDDNKMMECSGLVFTLSFDLNGNYLYFSNYTYRAGHEFINAYIDTNLQSHHIYVIHRINGNLVFPPTDNPFSGKEVHMTYQINSNGLSTEVSMNETLGEFQFSFEECRFKRIN